jgi:hypothetical protein
MEISLSEGLALIVVVGGIIGWFVRLEKAMGQKIDRDELEKVSVKLEIVTQQRLDKQDRVLDRICEKLDEHAEKESNYRHDSRDKLAELNLKVAVLIKQQSDLIQSSRRE